MPKVTLNPPQGVVHEGTIYHTDEHGAVDLPKEAVDSLKERGLLEKDKLDPDMPKPGVEGQDPDTGMVPQRTVRK